MHYFLFLLSGSCLSLQGAIVIDGPTTDWQAILPSDPTRQSDYFNDEQAQAADIDIVGNADNPGFYVQFWNGGDDTSRTDGQLAFRLRISGEANPAGFSNYAFIGMDLTGDGVIDIFAEAAGGNDDEILIKNAGSDLNDGPSTTSITDVGAITYAKDASNFSWTAVTDTNDPGATLDIDGAAGNDYFVSFLIPYADLVLAASNFGIDPAYDDTKTISYIAATGTQANAINSDFNALNKEEASSTSSWETLGAISEELNADGTVAVPEPATFALFVGLAVLFVGLRNPRRRK
ncbi:PEP-CTERM sorting domain-containing protein [Puniceicoccales bacterium CK1056]|uniref:PEP-CTERM sorting domain-containing protein n=1 Tax=Oceanipulchritudo coccoides TaxID=2706888 RepID=A0A6B2M4B2_9BACT|nr:PEP-CTERM sorting domain-containing protein [Oceanipulchritudo coccoides]NDV62944.1 PEP-CTERM sorting domain-containing protein [Oceanipulchritudo coccoides]